MDREVLVKRLKVMSSLLNGLAKWTPTDVDNKLAAVFDGLVDEDWFIDLLVLILDKFDGKVPTADEMFKLINEKVGNVVG